MSKTAKNAPKPSPKRKTLATPQKASEAKPRPKMGRPTLFTPERVKLILSMVAQGNYITDVAEAAGVGRATLEEWIARGEGRDPDRLPTPEFADFAAAIKRAQGEGVVRSVARLQQAAAGAVRTRETITVAGGATKVLETFFEPRWQAAAWLLERRYPERWGRRDRHELTSPGSDRVEVGLATSELQQVIERVYGKPKIKNEQAKEEGDSGDDAT